MTLQGTVEVCTRLVRRNLAAIGTAVLAVAFVFAIGGAAFAQCPTCSSNPCTITGTHTIASGATCNYAGYDVTLTGTLQGDNNAACYTVIADSLTVRGTLRARSACVNVDVEGLFKTEVVSNSAATVDVRNANSSDDGVYVTCGSAIINGKDINADADGSQTPVPPNPNPYWFAGTIDIECTGNISGTGGPIHAQGSGGDDAGTISLVSTGGSANFESDIHANGGGNFSFGGSIIIAADTTVTLGTGSKNIQAQGSQDGAGGSIEIVGGSTVTINGTLNVNGNGTDADAGSISVSGSSVTTGTTWNAKGDLGGDGGAIAVEATSGTVTTTAGSASWNATGSGFSDDGGWGGEIEVSATGNVTLNGDMDAAGNGESAFGGVIVISTDGNITQEATSRIEADSTGTDASNGFIEMSACNMTMKGDVDTRNMSLDDVGQNDFDYGGTFTQNNGSVIQADDSPGNNFYCRCVDTSPADGTCDTPNACVSPPTLNGTVNPAASIFYIARAACP